MLKETDKALAEDCTGLSGYDKPKQITAAFKTLFKVLPKEYREK